MNSTIQQKVEQLRALTPGWVEEPSALGPGEVGHVFRHPDWTKYGVHSWVKDPPTALARVCEMYNITPPKPLAPVKKGWKFTCAEKDVDVGRILREAREAGFDCIQVQGLGIPPVYVRGAALVSCQAYTKESAHSWEWRVVWSIRVPMALRLIREARAKAEAEAAARAEAAAKVTVKVEPL